MDRPSPDSPIHPSFDGAPPAPSNQPAGERSLPLTTATEPPPAVAEPSPFSASGSGRPAGFDPIPPPPPPPGARRPAGFGASPPAAITQPPTAANPPRPGDHVPPSGPPTSPPPVPSPGSSPLGPDRRGWRVAARALAVVIVALSLVSGGIAIGSAISDDTAAPAPTTTSALRPATDDGGDGGATGPLEVVPGPLADEDVEEPVTAVAQAVSPSVVLIQTNIGQGSGIVWDADEGYIVTNDHVIGDAGTVIVQFANGNRLTGVVVGGDSSRDIAVIQVDPAEEPLVEAVFAPTSTVEVGQLAVAIGSPFGLDQSVTSGIVSAVNRVTDGGSNPAASVPVEMIQTDAPINPGNSGGALADRQGRVIGMNTQIRTSGTSNGNVGVGFAVPSDTIQLIAQRIVDGESLELAFLGIDGDTPTDGTVGALVVSVVETSPADGAGLTAGDLIVGLDGESVHSMAQLAAEIKLRRPGDTVDLELVRDGNRFETTVTLGAS